MHTTQRTQLKIRQLQAVIPLLLAAVLLAGLLWVIGGSTPARATDNHEQIPSSISNSSVAGNTITLGVSSDLSGFADFLGWRQVNAVQLAVDQINAAGGLDIGDTSYTLTLVSADSGCDPIQAITATNTLLDAGVVAVVGPTCSGASLAAQPLFSAAGVPLISPSNTNPLVTEQGYTTTFRVITRDDSPPVMLAEYLRGRLGFDAVALVDLGGYHAMANDVFSDTFSSLGGTITSRFTISSTADFTATLTSILAENPDAIHFPSEDGGAAGLLSHIAHSLGMTGTVVAWSTFSVERSILDDYTATAGTAAKGDIAAMYYRSPDDMPGYDDFNADYVAAGFANYGDEAQSWGAFAYDAAQIILAAIDRAGSLDPADIRDEIAATNDFRGVVGTYEGFDDKGDVIPQWTWIERYQEGEWARLPHEIFLPVIMLQERTGERINIFDSGSQTYPENTPFHIAHGFLEVATADIDLLDFQLQMDGNYREEDFFEAVIDDSSDPPSIHKTWVFNFPTGMAGKHTFSGHWFVPCKQVNNDCAVPNEIVESRTTTVEVTFVP